MRPAPPGSEDELFARADRLAGRPLSFVADELGVSVPPDLRRNKGWIGELLELALGASAGSRAEPDFPHLGVEMKTLPVDARGVPRESTYVCTAPLDGSIARRWEDAWVRRKLSRVLWIPVMGDSRVPVGERVLGAPLLWSPDADEDAVLRADWEELTQLLELGDHWQVDARRGRALQVRPKAATGRELTWTLDAEAEWVQENPRGFYLRASFTRKILARYFQLP